MSLTKAQAEVIERKYNAVVDAGSGRISEEAADVVVDMVERWDIGYDSQAISDAMCDGELLGTLGITQEIAEEIYNYYTTMGQE